MSAIFRFAARVREFFTGRSTDAAMSDELTSHMEHLTDEYLRRGLTPDAARRAAARDFGAMESAKEAVRDRRGFRPLETLGQDVRYAIRLLIKTPGFSLVAIVTLALGIGANTAIFSLVDTVVLRPLPYSGADRLVSLWETKTGAASDGSSSGSPLAVSADRTTVSVANLVDYRRARSFSGLAAEDFSGLNLTGSGDPEFLNGEKVTWNYFDVLAARPALGRVLLSDDDRVGAEDVIVLSDALWRRRFAADDGVTNRIVSLDGRPTRIVGVMPAGFRGVSSFASATNIVDFWVPIRFTADLLSDDGRGDHEVNVVGRLRDGVSVNAGQRELNAISADLAQRFPKSNGGIVATVAPLASDLVRTASASLWAMLAMVAVILLIACVNVANLLIVRGVSRKREIAVRLALGADRSRIIRELLTQSLVLALAGGVGGAALSVWTRRLLVGLAPANTPRLDQVTIDLRVLAMTFVLVAVTGIVFGLLPAWQASRERPVDALRSTERVVAGTSVMRWRNVLMTLEVSMSAILLVGAGLTLRSLTAMNQVPLGFRTDHVLVLNIAVPDSRYPGADARYAFFEQLAQRMKSEPGVEDVAFANRLPLHGGWGSGFQINGVQPPAAGYFQTDFQAVSPGYFSVFGIQLRRGRLLNEGDRKSTLPVAVVTEAFGTRFMNGADPIGHTLKRGGPTAPLIEIVGVVADVRRGGQLQPLEAQVYLPAAQTGSYPVRLADVAVRTAGDPSSMAPALQRVLWSQDPSQPVTAVLRLDDMLFQRGAAYRFRALLFGMSAGLALVLSLIGIYGVVSYAVSQRTPEIGIRMALGASRADILKWLVGGTAALVVGGAAIGLLAARALSSSLEAFLFGVTPADATTYMATALALSLVAIGSALIAARRATRIDPARALRGD
jgi:predicted permease